MTYDDYAQALEERLGPKLCNQLGRLRARRVGERQRMLIIGLGGNFYHSNSMEALKSRLNLEGKPLHDACEYLQAVVDMRMREERQNKQRNGWGTTGRQGWMY